jgi:restriction endonuclease S subunit
VGKRREIWFFEVNLMKYAVVNYRQHKEEDRLDAEFFQIEELLKKLQSIGTITLQENCSMITQGPNPYFVENGIPCLTGRNISRGKVVYEDSDCVDEKYFRELKKFHLNKYDILITLKGAGSTGKVAIFTDDKKAMFSRNIGLIRLLKNSKIEPMYLYAFLSSEVGQKIADRGVTGGTGQLTLPTGYLKKIQVPVFSDNFIKSVSMGVSRSIKFLFEHSFLYKSAEKKLLEEIDLIDWKPRYNLAYVRKHSEVQKAERFDAEHFQPKYDEILDAVRAVDHKYLGKIVKYTKGIEVGSAAYQEDGVPFIRVSDVSENGIERFEKRISRELYDSLDSKYTPQKGDILMTKDGTIGITFVVDENIPAVLSGAFLKLTPKIPVDKEYLALVLNSIICSQQIEKIAGGAVIAHLKPSDAEKIVIPLLDQDKQKMIAEKVMEAKKAREKSMSLLEIAKTGVEKAIEEDESSARAWMMNKLDELGIELDLS